jgi:hypothetical protein
MMKPKRAARHEVCEIESAKNAAVVQASSALSAHPRARFGVIADWVLSFSGRSYGVRSMSAVTPEIARAFVVAPFEERESSVATMQLRRVVGHLFRRARKRRIADHAPGVWVPARSGLSVRSPTHDEIAVCRSYRLTPLTTMCTPARFALAEADGRSAEIPHIRVRGLDRDEASGWLYRSQRTGDRWMPLTEWRVVQLERNEVTLALRRCA